MFPFTYPYQWFQLFALGEVVYYYSGLPMIDHSVFKTSYKNPTEYFRKRCGGSKKYYFYNGNSKLIFADTVKFRKFQFNKIKLP